MKDPIKNYGAELAADIAAHFQSSEVRELLTTTKAASDAETGTFEVVITTENLDRYKEVIKLDGWELEHYLANPVVLWGHDHSKPIGMATSVEIRDGKMIAKGKFAPTDFAQEIRRLYDFGIIRATSVGFIEKEREGNLITKAELLEFSFVSVPANPFALSLAMQKELSVDGLMIKGFMHVEKDAEEEVIVPANENAPEEEIEERGAVQEEQEAVEARQKKWKNFSQVDDVIWAFMNVYFDTDTPVDDFEKLLGETIELLMKINGSEKAAPAGLFKVEPSNMRAQLQRMSVALEVLGTKSEEPEGDEAQRQFDEFTANRKLLQGIATGVGEVLANMRQVVEARR